MIDYTFELRFLSCKDIVCVAHFEGKKLLFCSIIELHFEGLIVVMNDILLVLRVLFKF